MTEFSYSRTQASKVIAESPAAKSTLAPLEDSVEVIAQAAPVKLVADTAKTQEILDKTKQVIEATEKKTAAIEEAASRAKAVPVPAAIAEMADAPSQEIVAAPVFALQPTAPVSVPGAIYQPVAPVGAPGTAYPYASVPFPNSTADPWGMYMRQCVSYTAWKIASSGRNMPYWGGRGNAVQWDENARAEGIPVDTTPRVGSILIDHSMAPGYGHSAYVEEVYGDGTVLVSQYNARRDGAYSVERRNANGPGVVYIHF